MGISAKWLVPGLITGLLQAFGIGVVPWASDALAQGTTPPTLQSEQDPKPAEQPNAKPAVEAGKPPAEDLSAKEKELLERIRKLKAPRWRSFGPCRYDWNAWRLSEGAVRSTSVECGDPPVLGSVAVHCASLKLNRRTGTEAWQGWRLPLSIEESKTNGGEDRMAATLCANAQPIPGAAGTTASPRTPPAVVEPAKATPKAP